MKVDVHFEAPAVTADGLARYEPGQTVRGTVLCRPERDAHTRGLMMAIGCHIHGSGTPEDLLLQPEIPLHVGDLTAGQVISHSFEVALPADAPVSYEGRRVKFDWALRLRVDIPIWPDQRSEHPFVVTPRGTSPQP
ncbi:MAG: hypothetical protein HZB16_18420 [Armatimonadetes bacterium]|nr:hypothetical protein [Armatimonadota bacterium]